MNTQQKIIDMAKFLFFKFFFIFDYGTEQETPFSSTLTLLH
ncbi:Uncharacterised protein [Elizabethkingia miricola]|nr:Uncharacterised protein [Elizabethkingia miricola]